MKERKDSYYAADNGTFGRARHREEIHGKEETRRFLESLGFVEGVAVTVISQMGGNLIVNVKDTRVALSRSMASRIMI